MVSSNSELSMKQSVLWSFGSSRWKANVQYMQATWTAVTSVQSVFSLKKIRHIWRLFILGAQS